MNVNGDQLSKIVEQNQELVKENDALKTEIKQLSKNSKAQKKAVFNTTIKGVRLWAGADLKESFDQVYDELPLVTKSAFAQLSASLVKRLTRIGFFTILFAIIPTFLILIQTGILFQQNNKLEQQVYLEEASRRNNLVFLMDNVLDQIQRELVSSSSKNLSKPLIARVKSLMYGFRPYRFLEGDILTSPLSPEKGQFLLALIHSGINTKSMQDIFKASFGNVYLKNANLFEVNLENIDMPDANLQGADLWRANFKNANLQNTNLKDARLNSAKLTNTDLRGTQLQRAILTNASLNGAFLENANFQDADLQGVDLDGAHIASNDWFDQLDSWDVIGEEEISNTYTISDSETNEYGETYYILQKIKK